MQSVLLMLRLCVQTSLFLSSLVCLSLKLEDGHTLFDYNVGLNEIVQLMIRTVPPPSDNNNNGKQSQKEAKTSEERNSNDAVTQVNGHASNDDEAPLQFSFLHGLMQFLSLYYQSK